MTVQRTSPNFRRTTVIVYVIALYLLTMFAVLLDTVDLPPTLLEFRNIVVHGTGYAIFGLLFRWSLGSPARALTRREWLIMLGVALLLGAGQEVLQISLRGQAYPINSLLDLGVDTGGAAMGVWLAGVRNKGGG